MRPPSQGRAIRYTLQALANHTQFNQQTAYELLSNVGQRLSVQTEVCDVLLSRLSSSGSSNSSSSTNKNANTNNYNIIEQEKNLRHLRYLNHDTHRLCDQVALNSTIFDRWSGADQHVLTKTFEQVRDRHACSLERWVDVASCQHQQFEKRVYNMLRRYAGIQLICQHGIMLGNGLNHGAVTVDCNIRECVEYAYTEASHICEAHLNVAPELKLTVEEPNLTAEICVRFWLQHALVELLKNAAKSTVEQSKRIGLSQPKPIRVHARIEEKQYIVIDIIDEGVGLSDKNNNNNNADNNVNRFFEIGHTSANKKWDRLQEQQSYAAVRSPLSSLGVGLPVSKIMMSHFGGNVELLFGLGQPNNNNNGCTARIKIPLDTSILEPEIAIKRGAETSTEYPDSTTKTTVHADSSSSSLRRFNKDDKLGDNSNFEESILQQQQ